MDISCASNAELMDLLKYYESQKRELEEIVKNLPKMGEGSEMTKTDLMKLSVLTHRYTYIQEKITNISAVLRRRRNLQKL